MRKKQGMKVVQCLGTKILKSEHNSRPGSLSGTVTGNDNLSVTFPETYLMASSKESYTLGILQV